MEFPRGSGSGDEDLTNAEKGKKHYHRHSMHQIQQLEAFFKVCPLPDENRRQQLGRELGLEPKQIKFWFQNKRTQMKAQNERADNSALQSENERMHCENLALREALENISCPSCNGIGEGKEKKQPELQRLVMENARLKEELEQKLRIVANYTRKYATPPTRIESDTNMLRYHFLGDDLAVTSPLLHEQVSWNSQIPASQAQFCDAMEMDRSVIIEAAISAMDELLQLLRINEPLWIKSTEDGSYLLHRDSYDKLFPKPNHFKSASARFEATKDSGEVGMGAINLIEMLHDSNKRMDMFPTVITKAKTIQVLNTGSFGGLLNLMSEKMHVLSPLVATREFFFIRYSRQLDSTTWVMVDVSNDLIRELHDATPTCSWKFPSGCMIEDLSNGKSTITWIEHVQVDDKSMTHRLYRDLVFGCQAYGAKRWIFTLQRMCERYAFSMGLTTMTKHELEWVIDSREGRRNIMNLSHRMVKNFFEVLSMQDNLDFPHASALNNTGVRVSLSKSNGIGQPNGMIVSAATSLWLPLSHENLFNFLKDERKRAEWDVLSNGNSVNAIAQISTGTHPGDCISVVQPFIPKEHNMLMLQESSIDPLGAMLIYAPIDLPAITAAMNGEDTMKIPILPSGYVISTDNRADKKMVPSISTSTSNSAGSLLTVAFQILVCCSTLTKQLNMESIATVHSLISSTVQKIKVALDCPELD